MTRKIRVWVDSKGVRSIHSEIAASVISKLGVTETCRLSKIQTISRPSWFEWLIPWRLGYNLSRSRFVKRHGNNCCFEIEFTKNAVAITDGAIKQRRMFYHPDTGEPFTALPEVLKFETEYLDRLITAAVL